MQVDVALIEAIKQKHRFRVDNHRAEKTTTLWMKAICRRLATPPNVARTLSSDELARAAALFDACEAARKGKQPEVLPPRFEIAASHLASFFLMREHPKKLRKAYEKELRALARQLPVWPWVKATVGFGDLMLGQIVGEAGDLSLYSAPGKLWKRLGVGIVQGQIQRKTTDKELAIAMGYNANRRAIVWNLGECLVKAGGAYADLYRERKAYEIAKAVAQGLTVIEAAKIAKMKPTDRHAYVSKGHIDRRAKRWMTKQCLVDLWLAWNPDRADDAKPRRTSALFQAAALLEGHATAGAVH